MVFGGWTFVAVLTSRSGWAPEIIGGVTVVVGSFLGAFIAGRQSPRQRLNEPVVAATLVAATLIGVAHFTETGAHHGGYTLVGLAFVGALAGTFGAHRLPGRGGSTTKLRGIMVSTLICCGSWVVMFFSLETWSYGVGDIEGFPLALGIIVTIFGCGAMARLAMPEASRRVAASGGFFCPMVFLAIGLFINRDDPSIAAHVGASLALCFFGVVGYGCAWAGAALTGRYLAKKAERVTVPPAAVHEP